MSIQNDTALPTEAQAIFEQFQALPPKEQGKRIMHWFNTDPRFIDILREVLPDPSARWTFLERMAAQAKGEAPA